MQSNLNEPRFESADVVRATGGSAGTLQMRLARGLIVATRENEGPGKRRLWSGEDILGLAAAEGLTKLGLSFSAAAELVEQAKSEGNWADALARCFAGNTREFYFVVVTSPISSQLKAVPYAPVIGEKDNVLELARLLGEDLSEGGGGFLVDDSNSGDDVITSKVRDQRPARYAICDLGADMVRAAKTLNEIDSLGVE